MLTPSTPDVNPAYSIQIDIPPRAVNALEAIIADAPGPVSCQTNEPDVTGAHRVILDTDCARTLAWLTEALHSRLGSDLLHTEDPVFLAAATGKLTQRVCAATTTGHDIALLDADADRRVISYLAAHPRHTDRFTGRAHRVALLSDASAVLDFEPMPAETALPAVESQAVHVRRATGLDIFPLPIAARSADDLATAIRLLAPGIAAAVLVHTRIDRIFAVRAALGSPPPLLLDAVNDGLAIAAAAAAVNALRQHDIDLHRARVVLVEPNRGGDLSGLLLAAGIRDLTLHDPVNYGTEPLHQLADRTDLIIDLIGLTALPEGVPVLRTGPEALPPLSAATTGPRPLHALPGLLAAAVTTRRQITPRARAAAVQALTAHTRPGQLLPPLDHPGLTSAVAAAATHALTTRRS